MGVRRPKLLQTLHAMLVKAKGRHALLKAGAVYTALDLLAQHRKGASFSKSEVRAPSSPRLLEASRWLLTTLYGSDPLQVRPSSAPVRKHGGSCAF